jgi:hypothetical protein
VANRGGAADPFGTGVPAEGGTASPRNARPARTPSAASSKASFFLKPGKTQLELTRGTWRSLTIPSKDFAYGSSLLVESPEDGAVLISGRNMTPFEDGPAKTESFEAGESGEQYAAEIWTIRGVKAGIATIRLLDDDDQEYELEVTVKGDTRHFDAMVKRFHPKAKVEAHELTAESIVITGEATAEDSVAILEIAEQLYGNVLLRLKTQPVSVTQLDEFGFGSDDLEPGTRTNSDSKTSAAIGVSEVVPTAAIADPYADSAGAVGVAQFEGALGQLTSIAFGVPASSPPPAPTTQVRFLHSGFISMQTPAEPGTFKKVQAWSSWTTWKMSDGQNRQIRYSSHRENIPQGSQTPLRFRTTEFRDDVWVNAVLLTAAANDKTRYHLQHFPIELILENHEVVAAARGELVTRYVVLKDPNRAPVQTKGGETEEDRESFTGPNSFEEAIAESRKHGELLAVLVLGPESKLQRRFTLPRSANTDSWAQKVNPYAQLQNPYGEEEVIDVTPKDVGSLTEISNDDNEETGTLRARPAGSVSTEMKQLRQEVRSLREQLGKLVEVLSHEPRTKPAVIDRGTGGGLDTSDGIDSPKPSTSVLSPFSEDPRNEALPTLKPRSQPVRGEAVPVESKLIPPSESVPEDSRSVD